MKEKETEGRHEIPRQTQSRLLAVSREGGMEETQRNHRLGSDADITSCFALREAFGGRGDDTQPVSRAMYRAQGRSRRDRLREDCVQQRGRAQRRRRR